MRKNQILTVVSCLLCLLLVGCTGETEKFVVVDEYSSSEESTSLEDELKKEKYVERAVALFVDDELLVVVQVNPLQKWRKGKVEEKLQKKYEEKYPDYQVLVSSDYKIYLESINLIEKEDPDLVKKVKELKELAKEET